MTITDSLTGLEFHGDHAEFSGRRIRLSKNGITVLLIPRKRAQVKLERHEVRQISYQK